MSRTSLDIRLGIMERRNVPCFWRCIFDVFMTSLRCQNGILTRLRTPSGAFFPADFDARIRQNKKVLGHNGRNLFEIYSLSRAICMHLFFHADEMLLYTLQISYYCHWMTFPGLRFYRRTNNLDLLAGKNNHISQ